MQPGSETPHPTTITPVELQEIVQAFADSNLRELRLKVGDVDLLVSRNEYVEVGGEVPRTTPGSSPMGSSVPSVPTAPSRLPDNGIHELVADPSGPPPGEHTALIELRSPAVGMFYRRPAPDKPPFVETGSDVAIGDPVGTVEVMKMFTTVNAQAAGKVVEVCVEDATLVEHNQVLMYLAPATP